MKKHILVVAQYFYPEQFRINDICTEWVKRGYKVTVLTGIPNYPKGKYYEGYGLFKKTRDNYNGINIIRIPLIPRGNNAIMMALNYVSFVISGLFWSILSKLKVDFVFIYEVSPMTQALPGVWYGKRRRIPCYLYVTDLWPENVEIVAGIKNRQILNAVGKMVDYIYKRCDRIFTSSNSFIKAIAERGVPLEKLEFWPQYAEDYYIPMNKSETNIANIPQDDAFNIIFAGNIGTAQGLDILPKVANVLQERGVKVRFNMVGDGRFKASLIEKVKEFGVEEMFNFIGSQPATQISEYMAVCNATLISLAKSKVFSITIPAKTQSCMACGIPIILSADGEVQDIIAKAKAGLYSNAADAGSLAQNIEAMTKLSGDQLVQMGLNAREYYNKNFNKEVLLDRMDVRFGASLKRNGADVYV